ncbi:MAG: MBL fold metallo-hydrolase [Chloroflexi bacterium]|nr:MBL fold metallo-hydrolase [Chloroflexota bacterium]
MKLTCVVDNTVRLSSPLWGEHGLAVLIELNDTRMLFDTGASGTILLHNLALLNVRPADCDALVLSHGHYDHTGGLALLLEAHPGLKVYAHPGVLRARYMHAGDEYRSIGMPMESELLRSSAELHLGTDYKEVLSGVWTTGQISERSEAEGRGKGHMVRAGDDWLSDPYEDDQALVLRGKEGVTLLCGCCHAGLLNTIEHVKRVFGVYPRNIIGGMHLASADEGYLQIIAQRLEALGSPQLYPCHCTGQNACTILASLMGKHIAPWAAGSELTV